MGESAGSVQMAATVAKPLEPRYFDLEICRGRRGEGRRRSPYRTAAPVTGFYAFLKL